MILGVTLGDCGGIGPEVALKAVARVMADDESTQFVLIGDGRIAAEFAGLLGVETAIPKWSDRENLPSRLYLEDCGQTVDPGQKPGQAETSRAAVVWLCWGGEQCLAGNLDGLITAPVNKAAIGRSGIQFVGQTEFLAELASCPRVAMMLLGDDDRGRWLRVALVTTHLPLKAVPGALTVAGIVQTIELAVEALVQLGLQRRRVGVCGLNPHAGEGGLLGREEIDLITPAILEAQRSGCDVIGPVAADTLFYRAHQGEVDAVVAMYHDQGLAPLKLVAFENGVNWTVGLPFVRTSPDHGTAYDLVGQGVANESSMVAAIRLARRLAEQRVCHR